MLAATTMTVESHRSAATLYATGELTTANVHDAIASVEQLPQHVRALCVDLRGVWRTDSDAMRALDASLRVWRASRRGVTRVKLAENADTTVVAIRFTHRRRVHASAMDANDWE